MKIQHFNFLVENMTTEQAEALLVLIIQIVEAMNLKMGGGIMEEADNEKDN